MVRRLDISNLADDVDLSKPAENRRTATRMHGTESSKKGRSAIVESKRQAEKKATFSKDFIAVHPDECYISPLNRRNQELLKVEDYQDKIDDFRDPTVGQIDPIVVRENPKNGKKWEVLAGSVRHAAAAWVVKNTSVEFMLKASIRDCNDVEATRISNKENTSFEISAYENAFGTRKEIDNLFDGVVAEYCRVMGEKETTVNELLAFTQIPHECLDAFESPKVVRISHATAIRAKLKKQKDKPEYKKALMAEAKLLAKQESKLDAKQTLKRMLDVAAEALSKGKKIEPKKKDIKIAGDKKGIQINVSATGITNIRLNKVCMQNNKEAKQALLKYIEEAFND